MKQKRWILIDVPDEATSAIVNFYNDSMAPAMSTRLDSQADAPIFTGPVELMQAACEEAGVVYRFPRKGEAFFRKAIDGKIIGIAEGDFESLRFVIPAEPEPCHNCQNAKGIHLIESSRKVNGEWICYHCNRPESEWTYAEPDWAGIGSGIM